MRTVQAEKNLKFLLFLDGNKKGALGRHAWLRSVYIKGKQVEPIQVSYVHAQQ
jgi:hypothetical protein